MCGIHVCVCVPANNKVVCQSLPSQHSLESYLLRNLITMAHILPDCGPCTYTVYLIDILDNGPFVNELRHEKTNILVSDLVGHKPGSTAIEDG